MHQHKDLIEVAAANLAALFVTVKAFNEYLSTVSLMLAIAFTLYKFYKEGKDK